MSLKVNIDSATLRLAMLMIITRDSSSKIVYKVISEAQFASRQMLTVIWSKPQEPIVPEIEHVESSILPRQFSFHMATIATPDKKQSEAYIATVALFAIFGSTKEEKVFMRLPPAWKDLWNELSEAKKSKTDARDRENLKALRSLVRQRQDQEEEDGVVLHSAFKGRGGNRNGNGHTDQSNGERGLGHTIGPEYYQRIWVDKSNTPKFHHMLVSNQSLLNPSLCWLITRVAKSRSASNVAIPTRSSRSCRPKSSRHNLW